MFNPNKTDSELGFSVHERLEALGLETPYIRYPSNEHDSRVRAVQEHVGHIMTLLGLDLNDDSLAGTPRRVAKMWMDEIMWGLRPENFPKVMTIDNKMDYNEMLVERDIEVMSLCEHHLVTIEGKCHIAYIPKKKVMGLSKFNRIVEYFARRPQVQERLTAQIYEAIRFILDTNDVAVFIDAKHYCVASRGVEDRSSETASVRLGGVFLEPAVRQEFYALVRK